jgi:CubicO group peptidase (beta-lactamase class C family)
MNGGLDYTPGTTSTAGDRYSNFGYVLLGLIVERASGMGFNTYVNTEVLGPLGISSEDFKTSNSLLSQADPREPNYITNKTARSIYVPGTTVSARDGALNATTFQAAATSLTTSRAMAMFASHYKIDTDADSIDGPDNGRPLAGSTNDGLHYGDLPGTAAAVRQMRSGISYSVLMNKNGKFEGGCPRDYPRDVSQGIDDAIVAAGYSTTRRAMQAPAPTRVRPKVC